MKKMYIFFLAALATVCNVWAMDDEPGLLLQSSPEGSAADLARTWAAANPGLVNQYKDPKNILHIWIAESNDPRANALTHTIGSWPQKKELKVEGIEAYSEFTKPVEFRKSTMKRYTLHKGAADK